MGKKKLELKVKAKHAEKISKKKSQEREEGQQETSQGKSSKTEEGGEGAQGTPRQEKEGPERLQGEDKKGHCSGWRIEETRTKGEAYQGSLCGGQAREGEVTQDEDQGGCRQGCARY